MPHPFTPQRPTRTRRTILTMCGAIALLALVFFYTQVVSGERYRTISEKNLQQTDTTAPALRANDE
jgi:cell division protein FtsI/penicillin-binding protein 2